MRAEKEIDAALLGPARSFGFTQYNGKCEFFGQGMLSPLCRIHAFKESERMLCLAQNAVYLKIFFPPD